MTVSLTKGGNVSLTKEAGPAGLSSVTIGLGWDARTTTGIDFDLDASALVVEAGKSSQEGFIFYGNLVGADGNITHSGDNLTGEGSGDDEKISINVNALSVDIDKVVFSVTVYEAEKRSQNFGQVRNAYIRVVNDANGDELARYDLSEDASTETTVIFGELYRNGAEWKFRAVGQGYATGLVGLLADHGITAA